jgi:hypothetical protein
MKNKGETHMEKILIGFNISLYAYLRLFLLSSIVACGADDSNTSEEPAKQYRPTLWTEQQLNYVVNACVENVYSVTQETAPATCLCWYTAISKDHEYEVFIANIRDIQADYEGVKQECIDEFGERL